MPKIGDKADGGSNAMGDRSIIIYFSLPESTRSPLEHRANKKKLQLAKKADQSSRGSVPTSVVARAMLRSSLKEGEGGLLEHKQIVNLGKE